MIGSGPSPQGRHPIAGITRTGFLKHFITRPNIVVGDYTYYDDPQGPERFEDECVLYQFDPDDRLVIGRFCAIAAGVRFIMNGANHALRGFSAYPFPHFGHGWETVRDVPAEDTRGDTVIGSDVWLGFESLILPGVRVGHGAVVGARAVVSRDVPPYAVAVGNPARVARMRFPEPVVEMLLDLAWWDWDASAVTAALPALLSGDPARLDELAACRPIATRDDLP